MADHAWASVVRVHHGVFFVRMPNLIVQNPHAQSNLQLLSTHGGQKGYVEGRKKNKQTHAIAAMAVAREARKRMPAMMRGALGCDRRGCKQIPKKILKQIKKRVE